MNMDIGYIFEHSPPFAKGIWFVLAVMSLWSLTVAFGKWWNLRKAQKETLKFAPEFSQFLEEDNLSEAINLAQSYKKSHVERNMLVEIVSLKRGLAVLATVGSTSPFVGLLGTVFGIINAFAAMGTSGSTGIAAITIGIAEALIATGFGLLVAIPAVWFYNYFQTKIDNLTSEMTYVSKEMIDYLIKGVSGEFGRSRFTREFSTKAGGNAPISQ